MKKALKLLLILMMFIPLVAKADMGIPVLREYEAVVIKEEGADYYEYENGKYVKKGTLEKDSVITAAYEETSDGENYIAYFTKDSYSAYYVKSSDVMPKDKEVKPTSSGVTKSEKKRKIKINADSVTVRKGPSIAYDEIGTLKKDDVGSFRYYVEESGYIYAETAQLSGWVDTKEEAVLMETSDLIAGKEIRLSCATVPAGTLLKNVYITDSWHRNVLIEYNGCSDFHSNFKSNDFANPAEEEITYEVVKSVQLYNAPQERPFKALQKGEYLVILSDNYYPGEGYASPYYYVEYQGKNAWIQVDDIEEYLAPTTSIHEEEPEEEEPEEEEPEEEEDEEDEDEKEDSVDSRTVVLICVIVGVAIALTALVTTVLVNKKKKNNVKTEDKEEPKEEVQEDTEVLDETPEKESEEKSDK